MSTTILAMTPNVTFQNQATSQKENQKSCDNGIESEKAKLETKSGCEMKCESFESTLTQSHETENANLEAKSEPDVNCESSKPIKKKIPSCGTKSKAELSKPTTSESTILVEPTRDPALKLCTHELFQNPVELTVKQSNPASAEKKRKNDSDPEEESPNKVQKVCDETNCE